MYLKKYFFLARQKIKAGPFLESADMMNPVGCNSDQLKDILGFCGFNCVQLGDEKKLFYLITKKKVTKKIQKNKKTIKIKANIKKDKNIMEKKIKVNIKKDKKIMEKENKSRSKFSFCSFRKTTLMRSNILGI